MHRVDQAPLDLMESAEPPNGLELSCPAEAGRPTRILRLAGRPGKPPRRPSPPGQSKILVISQGFSELLGRATRALIRAGPRP